MSVHNQSLREFSISDDLTNSTEHRQSLITVIDKVADLTNEELESIVNLNVSESINLDNILIIRTK